MTYSCTEFVFLIINVYYFMMSLCLDQSLLLCPMENEYEGSKSWFGFITLHYLWWNDIEQVTGRSIFLRKKHSTPPFQTQCQTCWWWRDMETDRERYCTLSRNSSAWLFSSLETSEPSWYLWVKRNKTWRGFFCWIIQIKHYWFTFFSAF